MFVFVHGEAYSEACAEVREKGPEITGHIPVLGSSDTRQSRGGSKKHALSFVEGFVQSCAEPCRRKGRSQFCARSVLPGREHGKLATCLCEAAPAKAGNAASGFFQQPH